MTTNSRLRNQKKSMLTAYGYAPKAQRQHIRELQAEIAARHGLDQEVRLSPPRSDDEPAITQLRLDF